MKQSDSDLILLKILNSVSLDTSELLRAIKDTKKISKRDKHRRLVVANMRRFRGNSNKAVAIIIRLQALARMAEKNELSPWIPADNSGLSPRLAQRALIRAATQHPLSLINGNFTFEKESFLSSILELAVPTGPLQ